MPQIIRYYLKEDAILANVPTFVCSDPAQCQHVIANMHELVVKPTNESGGYGILMGPQATAEERQPLCRFAPLEPAELHRPADADAFHRADDGRGSSRSAARRSAAVRAVWQRHLCLPGGLTRVALRKGSMIVNSSQGGGSKDTWVLMDSTPTDAHRRRQCANRNRNSQRRDGRISRGDAEKKENEKQ